MAILSPRDLGIIMSYQCQAKCKHCLYACGPEWKEWMSTKDLEAAIESTSFWKHNLQIHLTGGEPFLNFPLLLQGAKITARLNIPAYVETNAGWCTKEDEVREKFQTLKEAGLNGILISCSPFQAERIPLKRALLAIQVAREIFSPNVIIYLPHCINRVAQFSIDKPVPIQAYLKRYGKEKAGQMFWHEYGLIPGGRSGFRLGHLTKKFAPEEFRGQNCFSEILFAHHSHFDVYGNYISWFCGGLTIGNWHELPQIVSEFSLGHFPPLIEILIKEGPYGLFQLATSQYGYMEKPSGYVGKCHFCVDIRRHLVSCTDEFSELNPRQFYQML